MKRKLMVIGLGAAVLAAAGASFALTHLPQDGKELARDASPQGRTELAAHASPQSCSESADNTAMRCASRYAVTFDEGEVEVTLDEVPDAVRATILEHATAETITEIVIDTERGVRAYEIETGASEFRVGLDGKYLGEDDEGDGDPDGDGDAHDDDSDD